MNLAPLIALLADQVADDIVAGRVDLRREAANDSGQVDKVARRQCGGVAEPQDELRGGSAGLKHAGSRSERAARRADGR